MARSGGPQDLGDGVETLLPILPRANLEDGTLRAIRSLLHPEMTGKISARSAQMAVGWLMPTVEPARIIPPIKLENIPTPTMPDAYRKVMHCICRGAVDRCDLVDRASFFDGLHVG